MYKLWQQGALNLGEVLATSYKELGLDESAFVFLLILARRLKGQPSGWSLSDISDLMTLDLNMCSQIFMRLVEDGFLLVNSNTDEFGVRSETYSLAPLFSKLEIVMKKTATKDRENDLQELALKIEQIFGVLSPRDVELVQMWMSDDGFDTSVIELALMEMQMHNIRSLKYVDKILLDWKRKNIYTVDEAKRSLLEFRNRSSIPKSEKLGQSTSNPDDYYNWIDRIKANLK